MHRWKNLPLRQLVVGLGALGVAAIAIGFVTHAQPYAATLGYDSAMTVGVLAFLFALAHGLPYKRALEILAPLVLVQIIGAIRIRASSAPIGTELVIFAAMGMLLLALRERVLRRNVT
jgi:hypothetical protein